MIAWPKKIWNHNYINKEIQPWLDLHFPADSSFCGRVFIGHRREGSEGVYNLTRRNIDELGDFVNGMHISTKLDYYITANAFAGVERVTDGLFALHNIVADIDCHGEDAVATPAELAQSFVWLCSRDLWSSGEMPEPNSIVMTGRGVQLWWAIDPMSVKLEWIYRRIQDWILDKLEELMEENSDRLSGLSIDQAASRRLAGWFRMPCSYNTKAQRWGTLQIRRQDRYSHQELLKAIPEDYAPKRQVANPEPARYVPLAAADPDVFKGGSSAMALRVYQLVRLRALRNAPIGEEMRDFYCISVYSSLLADNSPEEAWDKLQAFNAGFKEPLPEKVLKSMMSSAIKKQYHLRNEWVIAALGINEAEQNAIGLYPAGTENRQAKKRNHTRDTLRAAAKEDRDMKILALYEAGQSKAAIARELGISRNTVLKVIEIENEAQAAARAVAEEISEQAVLEAAVGAEPHAPGRKVLKNGAISSLFPKAVSPSWGGSGGHSPPSPSG